MPTSSTALIMPQTGLRVLSHTTDGTVPMKLDSNGVWRLAASEKDRCKRLGLCDYCAAPDHTVASCPVCPPPSSRRPRLERRAFLSVEVSPESSEKALTQE